MFVAKAIINPQGEVLAVSLKGYQVLDSERKLVFDRIKQTSMNETTYILLFSLYYSYITNCVS